MNLYSYSKVDNFTAAISSYVTKMLIKHEEEQVLRRIFENADHDNAGTLDEVKLHNAMTEISDQLCISQEDLSTTFAAINKTGDGQISYDEFKQASLDSSIILKEENLQKVFGKLAKGSTCIDAQKLKTAFGSSPSI